MSEQRLEQFSLPSGPTRNMSPWLHADHAPQDTRGQTSHTQTAATSASRPFILAAPDPAWMPFSETELLMSYPRNVCSMLPGATRSLG